MKINDIPNIPSILAAPAIFSASASPDVTPRYRFFSTWDLIMVLSEAGWNVVAAAGVKSHNFERARYAQHVITFENPRLAGTRVPRLVARNGHDGLTGLQLRLGFRIPETGVEFVAGEEFFGLNLRHMAAGKKLLEEYLQKVEENVNKLYSIVESMFTRRLTEKEKEKIVQRAIIARWKDPDKSRAAMAFNTKNVLEGTGDTLFEIFLKLQDELLKGGYRTISVGGTRKEYCIRGIRSGVREYKFRQEIFKIAVDFLELKEATA